MSTSRYLHLEYVPVILFCCYFTLGATCIYECAWTVPVLEQDYSPVLSGVILCLTRMWLLVC